jgi:hypothetical protein
MEYKRGGRFVCWLTKIGYNRANRVRAWQYHDKDYAKTQKAALALAEEWEGIVADYKRRKAQFDFWVRQAIQSALLDGYYLDENDNRVPPRFRAGTQAVRSTARPATSGGRLDAGNTSDKIIFIQIENKWQ